jgi:hypothetical protein
MTWMMMISIITVEIRRSIGDLREMPSPLRRRVCLAMLHPIALLPSRGKGLSVIGCVGMDAGGGKLVHKTASHCVSILLLAQNIARFPL